MANKYYRENLRNGTNPSKRKSNIAKIMEAFGPKKKDKKEKPKKRMFANKGGRAALKKGSKFPDHSGDGKITQKDILMAKGVIPKTKSKKKII